MGSYVMELPNRPYHVLDLATTPELPFRGASVLQSQAKGLVQLERVRDELYLDGKKVKLHLSPEQKILTVGGFNLRKHLDGKPVLGAPVLDYLLLYPELIPESWKEIVGGRFRQIFFSGTEYLGVDGQTYVRCLCWAGLGFTSFFRSLSAGRGVSSPTAVLEESWLN